MANRTDNIIYLDNSSTTKPYDEVVEIMNDVQSKTWGNPSSVHGLGIDAEKLLKEASTKVASTLNTSKENILFTSGGTEANSMALMQPFFNFSKAKGKHIIISSIEHPAINGPVEFLENNGVKVTRLPVDSSGLIDVKSLKSAVNEDTVMISVMLANNEVGTIQPINEICAIKEEAVKNGNRELLLHTDAVQAYGKIPIDLGEREKNAIDFMSVSAHKIHGPKGMGALFVRNAQKVKPFIRGGGQQRGLRSGTENVAGIAGFGLAAELQQDAMRNKMTETAELRNRLMNGLKSEIPQVRINSPEETGLRDEAGKCLPTILNVSFLGTKGEVILHSLEQVGIYVSTESACSSKKKEKSPVLSALGMNDKEIEGTIRFSLNTFTTEDEIEYTISETKKAVAKFRKLTGYRINE